jgi:hypothetical protein
MNAREQTRLTRRQVQNRLATQRFAPLAYQALLRGFARRSELKDALRRVWE